MSCTNIIYGWTTQAKRIWKDGWGERSVDAPFRSMRLWVVSLESVWKCWVWWPVLVIPVLGSWRPQDPTWPARLAWLVSSSQDKAVILSSHVCTHMYTHINKESKGYSLLCPPFPVGFRILWVDTIEKSFLFSQQHLYVWICPWVPEGALENTYMHTCSRAPCRDRLLSTFFLTW